MTSPTTTSPDKPTAKPRKPRKPRRWGQRDADLAEGLLLGMTLKAAAARANVPYSTAKRWRQDPVWNRQLMEAEAEAVKTVVRRGVRSAEAAMQVLAKIAGNVDHAAEHGEQSRVQVYAASRLLQAFTAVHARAVAAADADDDLATPIVQYVLLGVNTEALT